MSHLFLPNKLKHKIHNSTKATKYCHVIPAAKNHYKFVLTQQGEITKLEMRVVCPLPAKQEKCCSWHPTVNKDPIKINCHTDDKILNKIVIIAHMSLAVHKINKEVNK